MPGSCTTTVPNTPEAFEESTNFTDGGVFAWLRPANADARRGFNAAVDTIISEVTDMDHFRKFLHLDGKSSSPREGSSFTDEEDLKTGRSSEMELWSGAFKLKLAVLPQNPPRWCIGTAHLSPGVDILLAPQRKHWKGLMIAQKHAYLYLHHESYRVVLEARHSITISKNGARILNKSESHVLEHGELIAIGSCNYTFEYDNYFKGSAFETELSGFMKERFHCQSLNRHLSPTTVGDPLSLGNYYCSPSAFAQGTFGKVAAGWTKHGAAVAIKTFKNPMQLEIQSHKSMMEYLGKHDNVLQLLDCVSHFDVTVPDAYCVYAPLAAATLTGVIGMFEADVDAQVALFRDYANGLFFLHNEKGVMHRDINPNNLAVVSLNPPKGIIIDLDSATKDKTSRDHERGTRPYLAPEFVAIKDDPYAPPYDRSVDIWALGLSMFNLHRGGFMRWTTPGGGGMVRKQSYTTFRGMLEANTYSSNSPVLLPLIKRMMEWDPDVRIKVDLLLGMLPDRETAPKGIIVLKMGTKRAREE